MRVSRWMRTGLALAAMAVTLIVTACRSSTPAAAPTGTSGAPTVTGNINVFAAASLTEAFKQIATGFQAANPGAKVTYNFAGSSTLATQINQGAPADVFASAAPANMQTVTDAGNGAVTPVVFVRNQLVIA